MKNIILFIALLWAVDCGAITATGDTDNTNAPVGDHGWSWVVTFNNYLGCGVAVSNNVIMTAQHVYAHFPSITNDIAWVGGTNYQITGLLGTNGGFAMLKVSGSIPDSHLARLNSSTSEIGKPIYFHGCGPKKGAPVISTIWPNRPMITGIVVSYGNAMLNVTGDAGTQFMVQWTTNLLCWTTLSNIYTIGDPVVVDGSLPYASFRLSVMPTAVITNGNERAENSAGTLRWGTNTIDEVSGPYLVTRYNCGAGSNEGSALSYDSGGPCVGTDNKGDILYGIIEGVDYEQFTTQDGRIVYGSMFDIRGLTTPDGFQAPMEWGPTPVRTYINRCSDPAVNGWLKSFFKKKN